MSAVTSSVPSSNVPSAAFIAVPVAFAPTASTKYSAPATLLSASVSVAVIVGATFVGDGVTAVFDVAGPVVSYVTVLSVDVDAALPSPNVFIAAFALTDAVTVPSDVMAETATS